MGFPGGSAGKESACNAGDSGDVDLIPGLRQSPGEGYGNPLQYSCLENPWRDEPGGLQSVRSPRVRRDWSDWACTCFCWSYFIRVGRGGRYWHLGLDIVWCLVSQHSTMHRQSPPLTFHISAKNYLVHNVNSAGVESPEVNGKESFHRWVMNKS